MRDKRQEEPITDQQRSADAYLVYRELTGTKNYGRSKRRKGAE